LIFKITRVNDSIKRGKGQILNLPPNKPYADFLSQNQHYHKDKILIFFYSSKRFSCYLLCSSSVRRKKVWLYLQCKVANFSWNNRVVDFRKHWGSVFTLEYIMLLIRYCVGCTRLGKRDLFSFYQLNVHVTSLWYSYLRGVPLNKAHCEAKIPPFRMLSMSLTEKS